MTLMTEQTEQTETAIEKPRSSIVSTLALMFSTYIMLAVSIIGLPLGTVFFNSTRDCLKGKATEDWKIFILHFFKCGLVTLLAAFIVAMAYAVYLKFNQPTQTF